MVSLQFNVLPDELGARDTIHDKVLVDFFHDVQQFKLYVRIQLNSRWISFTYLIFLF